MSVIPYERGSSAFAQQICNRSARIALWAGMVGKMNIRCARVQCTRNSTYAMADHEPCAPKHTRNYVHEQKNLMTKHLYALVGIFIYSIFRAKAG